MLLLFVVKKKFDDKHMSAVVAGIAVVDAGAVVLSAVAVVVTVVAVVAVKKQLKTLLGCH